MAENPLEVALTGILLDQLLGPLADLTEAIEEGNIRLYDLAWETYAGGDWCPVRPEWTTALRDLLEHQDIALLPLGIAYWDHPGNEGKRS